MTRRPWPSRAPTRASTSQRGKPLPLGRPPASVLLARWVGSLTAQHSLQQECQGIWFLFKLLCDGSEPHASIQATLCDACIIAFLSPVVLCCHCCSHALQCLQFVFSTLPCHSGFISRCRSMPPPSQPTEKIAFQQAGNQLPISKLQSMLRAVC